MRAVTLVRRAMAAYPPRSPTDEALPNTAAYPASSAPTTTTAAALALFAGAALAIPVGGYPQLFGVLATVSVLASVTALRAATECPVPCR